MPNPSAFVLLDEPTSLDAARFSESLTARHPGLPLTMPSGGDGRGPIVLNVAGSVVAVMQVTAPLPDGWQMAAKRAAMHWSNAEAVFKRHRSHLIVSVMGENQDHLRTAQIVTAVIGALAASHPICCGVLWAGEVANSREVVIDLSGQAFAPYPDFPNPLWVGTLLFQDPGTSVVGAVSVGLRRFIGREVEIEGQRPQLKTVVTTHRGLINYLLQPDIKLNDGDTIGETAEERITVRLSESPRFKGLPVFAIRLPAE